MKSTALLLVLLVFATPAPAFEIEEIGTIEATFGDESIVQPTVLARDGDEASGTAFLFLGGGGFSSFSLAGYSADNRRLGLEVDYMTEEPSPETAPLGLTITYAPEGKQEHWTSEDAPSAPSVTFTTFEFADGEGRAAGSFAAVLCYAADYESGADTGNCRPIEGRFDTRFFVEE